MKEVTQGFASLSVIEGPNPGKIYILSNDDSLGREAINSIHIQDPDVSRTHARIYKEEGVFIMEDLGSTNKTLVNGIPAQRNVLRDHDKILIGNTLLQFNAPQSKDLPEHESISSEIRSKIQFTQDVRIDFPEKFSTKEEMLRAHRRLAVMYKIGEATGTTLNLANLLETILDLIFEELPADRGYLFLVDDYTKRLVPKAVKKRRMDGANDQMERIAVSKTIVREVMSKKVAVLSADAMHDQRFQNNQSIVVNKIRSTMCLPLVSKRHKLLGVIHVDSQESGTTFSKADLDLLIGIARQSTMAIENAMLYQSTARTNAMLLKLGQGVQSLTSYLEKQAILEKTCQLACEIMQCTKSSMAMVNHDGTHLELCYAMGMEEDVWKRIKIEMGQGLCGKVARERKSIMYPNPHPSKDDIQFDFVPRSRYRSNSFLIVPVFSKETEGERPILGTISVTDKIRGGVFSRDDLHVLSIFASQVGIAITNAELYERATIDNLTRLYSRGFFFSRLDEAIHRARRKDMSLTLLMLDLDHFKRINDTHGHPAGDAMLRQLGQIIRHTIRAEDCAARYGGEEFAVLLPDADRDRAMEIAERLREKVAGHPFDTGERELHLTISIGIGFHRRNEPRDDFIKRTDAALYTAKQQGRNRVIAEAEAVPS